VVWGKVTSLGCERCGLERGREVCVAVDGEEERSTSMTFKFNCSLSGVKLTNIISVSLPVECPYSRRSEWRSLAALILMVSCCL